MSLEIDPRRLRETLTAYQRPSHVRSSLELIVTAAPLLILWISALVLLRLGWAWAGLVLTLPAAASVSGIRPVAVIAPNPMRS